MQAKLFYTILVALVIGIGVRTVYEVPLAVSLWLLLLGFAVAVVWRRRSEAPSAPYLLLFGACVCAFSAGLLRSEVAAWQFGDSALAPEVDRGVTLAGEVVSEPEQGARAQQFYIETDTDKILVSTDRLTPVAYGDEVVVTGELEQPDSFTTDLGRTFDYPGYLKAHGVEYRISFAKVEVIGSGQGNPIVSTLLSAKQTFITALERVIPEPAVGLGSGLLLGVKSALGDDIEDDFRRTGIIHIVVLSGYNVMLVVAFILFCFSFVLPLRWRLVAGVLAVAAFALIVGLSATVVRASVMAGLVLLSQFLGRGYNVLRALMFAGVLMLLINPYLLVYDIGFQLSFMATLGLILIVPQFEARLATVKKIPGVQEFLLATIATQIAVLPLLMYHIGQVSLISVVVNVLVLPVVPVAMLLTFFTGLLAFVSVSLASMVGYLAMWSLNYILVVAHWFSTVPYAAVRVPEFSAGGMLLLYVLMAGAWWWVEKRHRNPKEWGLTGWVIEEELDDVPGAGLRPAPEQEDLPIFFR